MRVRLAAVVMVSFLPLAAQTAPGTLHVANDPTLLIAPSSDVATGSFYVVNDATKVIALDLTVGGFTIDATHQALPAVTKLEGASSVEPGKRTLIKVTVSGAWPGAGATALLLNEGSQVGTIHLAAFPFGVSPEAYKDGVPYPLHVVEGRAGPIQVVNADALAYKVNWVLTPQDGEATSGQVDVKPLSTASIRVIPKENWFPWLSWLATIVRDQESDASLLLFPSAAANQNVPTWPVRSFRVHLSRGYWSDGVRPLLSTALVFALLAAGGICSLILTNWVPNRTTKLELQDRLDNLAGAVRNLSGRVDSMIRVGLRVERLRIHDSLNVRWIVSSDYPAAAKAAEEDIKRFERVVALVQQIDNTYQDVFTTVRGFAPTLMRGARRNAREAELLLDGRVVTDTDLAAAGKYVAAANDALNGLRALTDDFRKELAGRVASLDADLKLFTASNFVARARAILRHTFDWIDMKYADPGVITPSNFCQIDAANVKVRLIADIAKTVDALDQNIWKEIVERMLNDLRGDGLSTLSRAELRARELREEIKVEDLIAAIESCAYSIIVEPSEPKAGETARIWIAFNDRRLSGAAVKEELTVSWSFSDGMEETGWVVAHYFARSGSRIGRFLFRRGLRWARRYASTAYMVRAAFANEKGAIASGVPLPSKPLCTLPRERSYGHTEVELVRLGVALLAAIIGLLGGASEQIAKLDFIPGLIAVFLIGFSSDQIKNIITAKSSST